MSESKFDKVRSKVAKHLEKHYLANDDTITFPYRCILANGEKQNLNIVMDLGLFMCLSDKNVEVLLMNEVVKHIESQKDKVCDECSNIIDQKGWDHGCCDWCDRILCNECVHNENIIVNGAGQSDVCKNESECNKRREKIKQNNKRTF